MSDQAIVIDTWREKYRYQDEADYEATVRRVIGALTKDERLEFQHQAMRLALSRDIVPAGRILAGAGTDKLVTLINCFVSPDIQDSLRTEPDLPGLGIMDALSVASFSQQMGGGIGMDFSTIRPRGSIVKRTQSVSSGILPFMDMWDAMCATIRSSGSRRGAMMGTLGIWHPDVYEFIEAKQQAGRLTNFNVSVLVPDDFMKALENDGRWPLTFGVQKAGAINMEMVGDQYVYRWVSARELWDRVIGATYVHAEPGIQFIDRINKLNNLNYVEHIHTSNPCGEQALPANGCCDLGHTNLAVMVDKPFTTLATFNWQRLHRAVETMVRLLDNVLDLTLWPTEEQHAEAMAKRRIGLGFTGLGSALQQLNLSYGSPAAVVFTRAVAKTQAIAAYKASCELAKERGPFPLYDADQFCDAPFVQKLDREVKAIDGIRHNGGIRNGVLLSIAPTGTTSLVVGNVSSGIEPVFAHKYRRNMRDEEGNLTRSYDVYDYGYLKYCEMQGWDPAAPAGELPSGFITADQLTVEQHLEMAAAAQEWVDSAISKTINCPTSITLEEFKNVYTRAYAMGMKGCTTYRPDPRSKRGAILETPTPSQETDHVEADDSQPKVNPPPATKVPMQEVAEGRRYRVKWPLEDCAYYIHVTDYVNSEGQRRPFELFISTKSERHAEWIKALSLLVTAIFRREGDPTFVVEELRSVFSSQGGTWMKLPWGDDKPKLIPSLVAAIGVRVEEHMRWLGMMGGNDTLVSKSVTSVMPTQDLLDVCVHCGARAVTYAEGCSTCHACGRSDCG